MFKVWEQTNYLPPEKERIIRLMMSFNKPMVAPSNHPAQPTNAYICTYKEDEGITVYIYLYLTVEKIGVLYKYDEKIEISQGSAAAEEEAVQFAEDLGFMIDDLKFNELDSSQQEKLLATVHMFAPPAEIQEEMPTKIVEFVPEKPVEMTAAVAGKRVAGVEQPAAKVEQPAEKVLEQKPEEKAWEPESFLSKFRMRATAERLKKNR